MGDETATFVAIAADQDSCTEGFAGFPPCLGFVGALLSLIFTQFIWMAGVFGNAHRDDIAMISVLGLGAVSAFAGCLSGFNRHDKAKGSSAQQAAECLFGALNLAAGCFLIYAIVGISRRMY